MLPMKTQAPSTGRHWRMRFTSHPKCVALVRHQVGKAFSAWGYDLKDAARVILVCSELATNAVQHAHRPGHLFEVNVAADGAHCLVEVSDTSSRPPQQRSAGADDEHGRGLQLVAALAEETGHQPRSPIGKTVWARLILTDPGEDSDA
jgi:anti-sigma regulatory factor (Ser/Thr protein kinase)